MKKEIISKTYEVYIFSLMISLNIFFFIFIHNKYDMSPNMAFFVITLPIMIIQLIRIFKKKSRRSSKMPKVLGILPNFI